MIRLAIAFVRWACDPAKLEVLEGDLCELHAERVRSVGPSRAGWRALHDALSIGLRHSRLTTARARSTLRRAAVVVGLSALFGVGALPRDAATAPPRYTVNATDRVGRFTLVIEHQRVVRATMDEVPIAPERLTQVGSTVVIRGGNGARDFEVAIKADGGITWKARTP